MMWHWPSIRFSLTTFSFLFISLLTSVYLVAKFSPFSPFFKCVFLSQRWNSFSTFQRLRASALWCFQRAQVGKFASNTGFGNLPIGGSQLLPNEFRSCRSGSCVPSSVLCSTGRGHSDFLVWPFSTLLTLDLNRLDSRIYSNWLLEKRIILKVRISRPRLLLGMEKSMDFESLWSLSFITLRETFLSIPVFLVSTWADLGICVLMYHKNVLCCCRMM